MNQELFSSLPERWREIREFPRYKVSDWGRVVNVDTGRILKQKLNSREIVMVGLMKDRRQYHRSIPKLVARTYLSRLVDSFDTPIHLDGDPLNNHATNLMWRPLWFARRYRRQFPAVLTEYHVPIVDVESGVHYEHTWDAAIRCGLLEQEISITMENNSYVWPTGQIFRTLT